MEMMQYYYDKDTRLVFFRPNINERWMYASEFCVRISCYAFKLCKSDIFLNEK